MATPLKIRILLADDHALVRAGLRRVLDAEPDMEVVAEAGDGEQALRLALSADVDLAVLDVAMPGLSGIEAIRRLSETRPRLRTLVLSMHSDEQYFSEALRAGASGYVLKSAAGRDLVGACRAAVRGEPFIHPDTVTAVMREHLVGGRDAASGPVDPLTPRETEVVRLIAEGRSGREIAASLAISEKTVERHRSNALDKLGMSDRVALTRYAIRRGLIEP